MGKDCSLDKDETEIDCGDTGLCTHVSHIGCGFSESHPNAMDFSSKATMVANGWEFNWNDDYNLSNWRGDCMDGGRWCGFKWYESHPGDAWIRRKLVGWGTFTIGFQNYNIHGGRVELKIAHPWEEQYSNFPTNLLSYVGDGSVYGGQRYEGPFEHGSIISLTETNAVIRLNFLTFDCPNPPTPNYRRRRRRR